MAVILIGHLVITGLTHNCIASQTWPTSDLELTTYSISHFTFHRYANVTNVKYYFNSFLHNY